MCIQKNFLCKNENQNKPNGASPSIPSLVFPFILYTYLHILKVVDMRWGVRDEMTNEHMTTELCMTELRNCQRLSMGPNFIYFGGQKYGYRPIPTYIVSSELASLREVLVTMGNDVGLLDQWYRPDFNAVPPVSILQPIDTYLVHFLNKRVPKLQARDSGIW